MSLDKEARDRLWQHSLHEDNIFNNRVNFFLGFQSILLAVVAMLIDEIGSRDKLVAVLIIVLGLALSVLGWLIQAKQKRILDLLKEKGQEVFADYLEMVKRRKTGFFKNLSVTWILTNGIPITLILIWSILLYYILMI